MSNGENGEKNVTVIVKKQTDEDLQKEVKVFAQAQKYEDLLTEMREALNTKWNTDVFSSIESDTEMQNLNSLLSKQKGEEKSKPSSGVVKLREFSDSSDVMQKEFPDYLTMIEFVYSHAGNPESEHYQAMREVKQKLREKLRVKDFSGVREIELYSSPLEREATKALGRSFTYEEYSEWLRNKLREQNAK